jgi:hypothetical protein
MALDTIPLPYGLRDVKITPYTDAAATVLASTKIDLPYGRTFSFTDSEDFEELRGDDRVIASHGKGATVQWDLESGGLPFEAYKAMGGGSVTTSGTVGSQSKTFRKKVTDSRPYFRVEGQAISDSGGDVHVVIPRVKCTGDLSGEWKDGAFFLTAASGDGYAALVADGSDGPVQVDDLYLFIQNEVVTAISA